ncbi:MAG: glycosyltransferase [Porticoccaceae bacterium]
MSATLIDIVVPVYRDLEVTRRCLESVLASRCVADFELIVVDDASPEPALSAWLDEVAAAGRITLHRNPENLGFVATVNRAMALHPVRDAVLLNSDTEVAGNWLDRLLACAATDPRIATVTPFSNNGSICSYPNMLEANSLPAGWPLAELDALFATVNTGQCLDLPTGVGFCMYVRRACWTDLDGFDLDRFSRGYGEETDFCMRAAKAGWRNVLCADVFVFHEGSVSFGTEREALMAEGAAVMAERHPEYDGLVMDFLRADPAHPWRDNVTRARARGRRLLSDCSATLEELIAERDGRAAWLDDRLVARERDAARLSDQLAEVREHIAQVSAALAEAQRFVRDREADIYELRRQLAELEQHGQHLSGQLAELQARHEAVLNSRTWRYSRRLRRLLRLD